MSLALIAFCLSFLGWMLLVDAWFRGDTQRTDPSVNGALWFAAAGSSTLLFSLISFAGLLTSHLSVSTRLFVVFGIVGGIQQAIIRVRRYRQRSHSAQSPPSLLVLVPLIPLVLIAMTIPWNFMMATGMDAGNYEVTSSHFAASGSYWLDASDALQAASSETSAIASPGNTWWFDDAAMSRGRPYYLPLFPALLGSLKFLSGSHVASGYLNILLGGLNTLGVYGLILFLSRSKLAAAFGSTLLTLNLVFLYYAKQIMSEQLALTALLLLVSASLLLTKFSQDKIVLAFRTLISLKITILGAVFALMLTKLDSILPLLLLLGLLALVSPIRHEVRSVFFYSFSGFLLAIPVLSALIVPNYLKHASLPVRLPILGSLQGANFLLVSAVFLFFGFGCSALIHKLLRRSLTKMSLKEVEDFPEPSTDLSTSGRRMTRNIAAIVSLSIFLFLGILRPILSDFEVNHDAYNLLRLLHLWSPLVLAAIFVSLGMLGAKSDILTRIFLLSLGTAFVIALVRSQHSAPDLWWSRRYLVVGTVLGAFSVSAIASSWPALIGKRLSDRRPTVVFLRRLSVAVLASGALLWQAWVAAPLFAERQNEGVLADAVALAEFAPFATLHVVAANRGFVGLGNSVRSLRPGSTVVAMSPEELEQAVSDLAPGDLILLPQEWAPRLDDLVTVVLSGETAGHWANSHAQLGRSDREVRRRVVWSLARVGTAK